MFSAAPNTNGVGTPVPDDGANLLHWFKHRMTKDLDRRPIHVSIPQVDARRRTATQLLREIIIRPLADLPEAILLLADWFYAEWHDFDGRSLANIEAQLAENLGRDSIPITFLAQSGSEVIGTVSLDRSDLPSYDHISLWLGSLYVLPVARGAGVATALVRHVQQFATSRAKTPLYLWTPGPIGLYENCGWTVSQRTIYNSQPVTLMRFIQA